MFTASDTSTVCESQLLHDCRGLCFTNFCCNMKKTLDKSLLGQSVVRCEQLIQLCKRHHSASSIVARVKSWKSDMLFYEHLSIKKRPVFQTD